ncbi:PDGFA associated 1 family protein [Aspergillus thermomutatus]|uniref:Casein kinase substrate phosphoprotein PP28 domain-containing protein n=1 Tax=Aspergillus thermomutatus TaxID=41047 RepID=A0A397GN91_ASPTH|nr:uncharacterized protein CDV56_102511 [Aspergillus thermomutatus]RHZ52512.1 hypothetical protein CDV56_102511 [Aspergillus thermomutatus]
MAPRGRGKFSKPSRGGGKRFSRDVQPVDKDGNPVGLWREPGDDIPSSGEEDESEEPSGSEEESSDEDNAQAGPSSVAGSSAGPAAGPEMTREERRAAAKAKKLAAIARRNKVAAQPGDLPPSDSEEDESDDADDEDLPANPNHTAKSRSQLHKDPATTDQKKAAGGDLSQLSRREREAIEAQQARERYLKLHAEGKTEEARADLARLAIIREQREAERLRREAEKEEKAALARERAAARERELKRREETKGKKKGGPKKN